MQQQPPLAAPQLTQPVGRSTTLMWTPQPLLRVGERWVSQGELRHRFTSQELLPYTNEGLHKNHTSWSSKGRSLRGLPGDVPFPGGPGPTRFILSPVPQTQAQANHAIRLPAPPSSSSGPQTPVPQPHHNIGHPINQVQHHHHNLTSGASGPAGAGIGNPVGQAPVPTVVPVTSLANAGSGQDLNVSGIQNPNQPQLGHGNAGVHLAQRVIYQQGHSQTPQPNAQFGPNPFNHARMMQTQMVMNHIPNANYFPPAQFQIGHAGTSSNQPFQAGQMVHQPAPFYPQILMPSHVQKPPQNPTVQQPRTKKIIPIVDPDTGKRVYAKDESQVHDSPSPTIQSTDNSARNTPAPRETLPPSSTIAAEFATRVASVAAADIVEICSERHSKNECSPNIISSESLPKDREETTVEIKNLKMSNECTLAQRVTPEAEYKPPLHSVVPPPVAVHPEPINVPSSINQQVQSNPIQLPSDQVKGNHERNSASPPLAVKQQQQPQTQVQPTMQAKPPSLPKQQLSQHPPPQAQKQPISQSSAKQQQSYKNNQSAAKHTIQKEPSPPAIQVKQQSPVLTPQVKQSNQQQVEQQQYQLPPPTAKSPSPCNNLQTTLPAKQAVSSKQSTAQAPLTKGQQQGPPQGKQVLNQAKMSQPNIKESASPPMPSIQPKQGQMPQNPSASKSSQGNQPKNHSQQKSNANQVQNKVPPNVSNNQRSKQKGGNSQTSSMSQQAVQSQNKTSNQSGKTYPQQAVEQQLPLPKSGPLQKNNNGYSKIAGTPATSGQPKVVSAPAETKSQEQVPVSQESGKIDLGKAVPQNVNPKPESKLPVVPNDKSISKGESESVRNSDNYSQFRTVPSKTRTPVNVPGVDTSKPAVAANLVSVPSKSAEDPPIRTVIVDEPKVTNFVSQSEKAKSPSQAISVDGPTPTKINDFMQKESLPKSSVITPSSTPARETSSEHLDELKLQNDGAFEDPKDSSSSELDKEKDKFKYDRSFLLNFQRSPLALERPENLPNLEIVLDGPHNRSYDRPPKMNTDFTPTYLQSRPGRPMQYMPQKTAGGRNSQSGRPKQKVIEFRSTSTEALKTSDNAWKPNHKNKEANADEMAVKMQEILKKVRGILNKLTPDNFTKLVNRVHDLQIETNHQLSVVIDLVFEKAVAEQNFSTMYAQLCRVLSQMTVKGSSDLEHGRDELKFRNLIISKCQAEFERDNSDDQALNALRKDIEKATGDKKLELEAVLDYEDRKLRKKAVGNIKFIGELYKLKMLTSPIMMRIIGSLIDKKDEESLECLCKLLSTIGKHLDDNAKISLSKKALNDVNRHFQTMQNIVSEKSTSSRVRFLMMNVIDLRKNNWIPRREDAKPKTKAQVHEDMMKEEMEAANMLLNTTRRDDRRDDRKRSMNNNRMDTRDDGWSMVSTPRRTAFDSTRIKNTFNKQTADVEFRPGNINWGGGSSGGMRERDGLVATNKFAALVGDGNTGDRRRQNLGPGLNFAPVKGAMMNKQFASKSMPPPSEKPNKVPSSDNSKSSSRSSSRDSSLARDSKPLSLINKPQISNISDAEHPSVAILEEYASIVDKKEAKLCVEERFSSSNIHLFVQAALEWVLDKDSEKRKLVGQLIHHLIIVKLLTVSQFKEGSKPVIELTEDYVIDIPRVGMYFGEIFAPLLTDAVFNVESLNEILQPAGCRRCEVLAGVLHEASKLTGSNKVSELWRESNLQWTDLYPRDISVESFVEKHGVGFTLINNTDGSIPTTGLTIEKIQEELYKIFVRGASNDEVFGWITGNVKDVSNKKFIRALVTALVESQAKTTQDGSSILVNDDFENRLKDKVKVINKFIDNNDVLEMQCIYALQALSAKYAHPPGLLEKCFNVIYDQDVVSEDSFFDWEKRDDPEEHLGKGVCVASVQKFLRWLREAEADDADQQPH